MIWGSVWKSRRRTNQGARFLTIRYSAEGNSISGIIVLLGSNGRQPARLWCYIGSQIRWETVAMIVLGIQIGSHPQWGIRETENERSHIGSLPQRWIVNRSLWSIQRGSQPKWELMLWTYSSPRFLIWYHSLVWIENLLFIVGIGPILNEELKFIFWPDWSDCTCVYS